MKVTAPVENGIGDRAASSRTQAGVACPRNASWKMRLPSECCEAVNGDAPPRDYSPGLRDSIDLVANTALVMRGLRRAGAPQIGCVAPGTSAQVPDIRQPHGENDPIQGRNQGERRSSRSAFTAAEARAAQGARGALDR